MFIEIAIGLTAGLTLTIWFAAVLMAGEKIASSAGLGYAAQVDPASGGQTPVVSQILYLFLLVIFLSVDGHLLAIGTMLGKLPDPACGGVSGAGNADCFGHHRRRVDVPCGDNHHAADHDGSADDQCGDWHHYAISAS